MVLVKKELITFILFLNPSQWRGFVKALQMCISFFFEQVDQAVFKRIHKRF